jgi:hypothetical protein
MSRRHRHPPERATALTMGAGPRVLVALAALVPLWLVVLWSLA